MDIFYGTSVSPAMRLTDIAGRQMDAEEVNVTQAAQLSTEAILWRTISRLPSCRGGGRHVLWEVARPSPSLVRRLTCPPPPSSTQEVSGGSALRPSDTGPPPTNEGPHVTGAGPLLSLYLPREGAGEGGSK